MSRKLLIDRRSILRGLAAGGLLPLAGCSLDSRDSAVMSVLDKAEALTKAAQRALLAPRLALAPEYPPGAISAYFKPNGSVDPDDPDYVAAHKRGFADWRLEVGGLVEQPMKLSLTDLRALPSRSQITRHDCVEGWSCIGQWKGAQLPALLAAAGLKPEAPSSAPTRWKRRSTTTAAITKRSTSSTRFIRRPFEMNYAPLTVEHGAPLRLRVERQLGYKMAKYVMRIEAIDSFARLGRGRGGFWEDRGYEWYAGI
jgi:DMSO/TMAO reductase YedYZ molybdopterin-dependent catalytic subunit